MTEDGKQILMTVWPEIFVTRTVSFYNLSTDIYLSLYLKDFSTFLVLITSGRSIFISLHFTQGSNRATVNHLWRPMRGVT